MGVVEEVSYLESTNIWCDKLLAHVIWGLHFMRPCLNPLHVGLCKIYINIILLEHEYSAVKIIRQLTSTYLRPKDNSPLK